MTLVALLALTTQAWADYYVSGNGSGNWCNGEGWNIVDGLKMTESNGIYSITFANVAVPEEESVYQFKIVLNNWDDAFGATSAVNDNIKLNRTLQGTSVNNTQVGVENITFTITATSDVTISFNPTDKTFMISTTGMKVGDDITVEPVEGKTNEWTFAMPGSDVVLTPIYAPTKVTLAANDVQKGSVSMGGETKVEWTPTTWSGWSSGQNTEMTKSDGGITMTYTNAADHTYDGMIMENVNSHALDFFINEYIDDCTVTFSSDEGNISRIELSMTEEYSENTIPGTTYTYGNPHILPLDGWTFNGKSAVWEGEATNSLKLSSCSTTVEKITFYKDGGIPEGVTVNTDGTFTVAQTATVKVKATPAEGYKLKGWSDAPDCTDLVREITIEPGEEDMLITAIFEEMTYTATFTAANANTIEAGKATVKVGDAEKTLDQDGKLSVKAGQTVTLTAKQGYKFRSVEAKKAGAVMTTVTWNSTNVFNSAHEDVELSKWSPTPLSYEGITISFSGTKTSSFQAYDEDDHIGSLTCYGNNGDSFTFTAPSGKKFCKIEIINNGFIVFTNYDDWTRDADNKIVWSGTAANAVTLGSVYTDADNLNSIVFYLSE